MPWRGISGRGDVKLAALVYQQSGEPMIAPDAGNHVSTVNPDLPALTWRAAEEVLGNSLRALSSGLAPPGRAPPSCICMRAIS